MTTKIQKPFYKSISFIVCTSLLSVFAIIAIAMFVLITIRYNIYRNAVDVVNAAVAAKINDINANPTNSELFFNVMLNGQKLEYWTTNPLAAHDNKGFNVWSGQAYYLTDKFYLADFASFSNGKWVQNIIDNSDNEIWVYLTKPLAGSENDNIGSLISFKNLKNHIENLSFLPSALNGGTTQENISYIACTITFFVGTFVTLVPVLFMILAPKFANKKDKKSPNLQQVQLQQVDKN